MEKDQKELTQILGIISEGGWITSVFSYMLFIISQDCYKHIQLLFLSNNYLLETNSYFT